MAKYYLIEKWKEYEDRPCGTSYDRYDVREYGTPEDLQQAILEGSKKGGKLIPAKGLEIKLQLFDEPDDRLESRTDKFEPDYSDDLGMS
ncbi:MAG: hypothetical protein KKA79_10540 [Nanoarchaeota archaeon]|nr:hypothetical protein [Nanoarchaeota archaeon]